jgi:RNA polymerase sigma-70 factor (ECF subfamily)
MAAIASGDHVSFALLVERHLARTVGLGTRILGSRSDGEEVAQEAFSRVWLHSARWRPREGGGNARFTTWLYRIVVNLAIDRKRRHAHTSIDDINESVDESDDSFTQIHRRQVSDAVTVAVQKLPERQRAALALCFFEGLSNIEAAKIMALTPSAVESLLARARRALRRQLADTYEELSGH